MSKKIPASRRKRVNAAIGSHKTIIELCPSFNPYLWIGKKDGNDLTCHGCVRDNQVRKLRDMCNEILDRREFEKARAK